MPADTTVYYDPYDYEIDADPYPIWRRLRDEAPLYHNEKHDFYALSRYDDVLAGLVDNETFVSSHGITLESISDEPLGLASIIMMDPPAHTRMRSLVSRAFTPRRIQALEERVTQLCSELLDPLVAEEEFDFIDAFAGLVPPTVILALAGFPPGLADQQRKAIDEALHYEAGSDPVSRLAERRTRRRPMLDLTGVYTMLPDLMEQRRREPREDLLSTLLHTELEEPGGGSRRLTDDEVVGFVRLLSTAGSETVVRLLGFAAVELARHPDQRKVLVDDPGVIPNAIEELLRYEAPSPIQSRWVARDVELHGTIVPRGSKMALLNGSADRDERQFPDPDTFDVRRRIDRHLAFGYGAHFCIGAALARLEGRIALRETLKRFPAWDVDESGLEPVHTTTVRGYNHVPFLPA